jgi:AcrR family transcriptional regulator
MPSITRAPSLRSIKKDAARSALGDAARRVVLARGLDQVTVRDIASEVGVSPRTFNNYFSSKEEAVFASAFDRASLVAHALRRWPATNNLWHSLTDSLLEQFAPEGHLSDGMLAQARLVAENPRLLGEQLKVYAAIEQMLAEVVAERLGTDGSDLYSHQVAAAAVTAARVAFDSWRDRGNDNPFRPVLEAALRQAGSGFGATA